MSYGDHTCIQVKVEGHSSQIGGIKARGLGSVWVLASGHLGKEVHNSVLGSRYFPKGQISQESAPRIVVDGGQTYAAGPIPSCIAASSTGPGSDPVGKAGK